MSINGRFLMEQFCTNKFKYLLGGPPFLKRGPLKLQKGGPFDPHWPISRINPATNSKAQVKEKLVHVGQI